MKKIHVGKAAVQLTTVIPKLNESKDVLINLTHEDKKGKKQLGLVTMKCTIVDDEKPAATEKGKGNNDELSVKKSNGNVNKDEEKSDAKQRNVLPDKQPDASKAEKSPRANPPKNDTDPKPEPKSPRVEKVPLVTEPKTAPTKDIPGETTGKQPKQEPSSRGKLSTESLIDIADKSGKLKMTITGLEVKDLMDTGTKGMIVGDAQDPCVEISLGKQTVITARSNFLLSLVILITSFNLEKKTLVPMQPSPKSLNSFFLLLNLMLTLK
jgi:hypothetical protein